MRHIGPWKEKMALRHHHLHHNMHYFLTSHIETKIGLLVVFTWAVIAGTAVLRSIANYGNFLAGLHNNTPIVKTVARAEHDRMNRWLKEQGLNTYGDPVETIYEHGSPLLEEWGEESIDPVRSRTQTQASATSNGVDRYAYLMRKFPGKPWKIN